ncbi:MAG: hypothetical protein AB7K37_03770 [Cyclobacteriaceae bacterium]
MVILTILLAHLSYGQNTKGDRPIPNQRQVRETKFKSVKKKKRLKTRDISGRRLRTKNTSSANRANRNWPQPSPYPDTKFKQPERSAKPLGRVFNKPPRETGGRAWKGNISGHKLRVQSRSGQRVRDNVYPQRGPFVNNPSKKPRTKVKVFARTASGALPQRLKPVGRERPWKGNIKGGRVGTPSRTAQFKKVYPQDGRFVNHRTQRVQTVRRTYRNSWKIARAAKREKTEPPAKKWRVSPFSASGAYVTRGRKNVYWGKFSKGERPITRDITGRPLRTKNFRSMPAGLISRDTLAFFGRRPGGDRSFSGKTRSFKSASTSGRAWRGNISGHAIRGRNYASKKGEQAGKFIFPRKLSITSTGKAGEPLPGGGFQTRSGRRVSNRPLPAKVPGMGASGISKYLSRITGRKPVQGGGSVGRKGWNNQGNPIPTRTPGGGSGIGRYQGDFKRGELTPGFTPQGVNYAGNIKARKPLKGGGSVSGKLWNNRGNPIAVRTPAGGAAKAGTWQGDFRRGTLTPGFTKQGADYAGNIKAGKPLKGGGSVSGMWNNNGNPIAVRSPDAGAAKAGTWQGDFRRGTLTPGFTKQGADYAGNIKARKPLKGGGSVSGKLWNNQETPIAVRTPAGDAARAGKFQGTFRRGELSPGFTKQGADYTGNIKARKPLKGGGSVSGKLWNNNETPIAVRSPTGDAAGAGKFQGNIKAKRPEKGGGSVSGKLWNNQESPIAVRTPLAEDAKAANYSGRRKSSRKAYVQNPNAADESLRKQKPDKSTFEVAGLQIKVREGDYKTKRSAAKGSLPGVAPRKGSVKAGEYARGVKMNWNYKHNPNSDEEAMKVRTPGKASALAKSFQGNTKMRKYKGADLHPDAQFAHGPEDNVAEERTILTSLKLFWAKLFRRSSTQPDHLKDKDRKPRYDKREQGLWYN